MVKMNADVLSATNPATPIVCRYTRELNASTCRPRAQRPQIFTLEYVEDILLLKVVDFDPTLLTVVIKRF